jgi:hypothetical protein
VSERDQVSIKVGTSAGDSFEVRSIRLSLAPEPLGPPTTSVRTGDTWTHTWDGYPLPRSAARRDVIDVDFEVDPE